MRAGKIWQDPTRLDHLNSLGFIWKPSVNTLAQTIQGIEVYSRLYPGQPLSSSFRVPNTMQENMWPESLLGFPLGRYFHYIYKNSYMRSCFSSKSLCL